MSPFSYAIIAAIAFVALKLIAGPDRKDHP